MSTLQRFYLITWHESDGNDCTVFDTVVQALSREGALSVLAYHVEQQLNENKQPYSDDGSEFGYLFDCADDCSEYCDGHGGISLRDVEEYQTREEADANRALYHTEYVVGRG